MLCGYPTTFGRLFVQALGVVHVLTGADHLSAIATLSANVGTHLQAFVLGARWGIGHSTGLLLVGVIMIVVTLHNDEETIEVPKAVSTLFESLVGVFMILLGSWGIRRAFVKKAKIYDMDVSTTAGVIPRDDEFHAYPHHHGSELRHTDGRQLNIDASEHEMNVDDIDDTEDVPEVDEESTGSRSYASNSPSQNCCKKLISNLSPRTIALCAGIMHGLAGPGGVLGVSL